MRTIYLDHAAATPLNPGVLRVIDKAAKDFFANPSSFNDLGRRAKKELEGARKIVARFLGARESEIIFTSSGSESNSLALLGLAAAYPDKKKIVLSPIEHRSILEAAERLKKRGYAIVFLGVDKDGLVDLNDLKKQLSDDTLLVSIMAVNNEIGTIQPIVEAGKIIQKFSAETGQPFPLFHTDACQAAGYLNIGVDRLKADLLTFNGSKIYGPRGSAVLYVRKGIKIQPSIFGGGQESGTRAGTENLPAILGLADAVLRINRREGERLSLLRNILIESIEKEIPEAKLNGPRGEKRLANNAHFSFPGLQSEAILVELDKYGIYAGSGSACTSRAVEPSHVLQAIGTKRKYLNGAVRFSLGENTSEKDIKYVVKTLKKVIRELKKRYGVSIDK